MSLKPHPILWPLFIIAVSIIILFELELVDPDTKKLLVYYALVQFFISTTVIREHFSEWPHDYALSSMFEPIKKSIHIFFEYNKISSDSLKQVMEAYQNLYLAVLIFTLFVCLIRVTLPVSGFTRWESDLYFNFLAVLILIGVSSVLAVATLSWLETLHHFKELLDYYTRSSNEPDSNLQIMFFYTNVWVYGLLASISYTYTQYPLFSYKRRLVGELIEFYLAVDFLIYISFFFTSF